MIRRLSSFLLVVAVLCSCMTVTAYASQDSGWIELLEYSSVQTNGENWFTISGQNGSVTIPLQGEKRLRKIDMLVWNPTGQRPTSAAVTAGGSTLVLDILQIGSNMFRVVGYIPNAWYESITVSFSKADATSQTYEVLSCKVTPLGVQEFACDADVNIDGTSYSTGQLIEVSGNGLSETAYAQVRLDVNDWEKFDSITIWGSALTLGVTSMRVTLGGLGLPFDVSYMQTLPTGEVVDYTYHYTYTENYSGGGGYGNGYGDTTSAIEYNGKIIFCVTIDLAGVDRSMVDETLFLYLTGVYNGLYGYTFNIQYVNGNVTTADTSSVSWWHRFTAFLTDIFDGDGTSSDDFEEEAVQQGSEMDDLNDELQGVTKPPIEDIQTDVDDYLDPEDAQEAYAVFATLTGNSLVSSMLVMALTVALVAYVLYGKR